MPEAQQEAAILAVGSFGHAVGAVISELSGRAEVHSADGAGEPTPSGSGPIVLAMYHERPLLCHSVEQLALRDHRIWLPVFVDGMNLQAGPIVGPGRSACYLCFRKRRAQHDRNYAATTLIRAERARQDTEAYFPHHPRIAGALAWRMICAAPAPADGTAVLPTAIVTCWNLLTGEGSADTVLGCHGCPRCGLGSAARTDLRALARTSALGTFTEAT